jgi:ribosome-associated protein
LDHLMAADLKTATSDTLLATILELLNAEKAEEVTHIDLRGKSEIGDHMVVCSGRSTRQVSSLADKIVDKLKAEFGIYSKTEGKEQGDWALVDTGDVIVHIFRPEVREFYQLEKMWQNPMEQTEQV